MGRRIIATFMVRLMRLCYFFILVITNLLLTHKSLGQVYGTNTSTLSKYDSLYAKRHIEMVLMPNIVQRARITHDNPLATYKLFSTPQVTCEAGLNRVMHFNRFYSFIVGIHIGVIGRNASFIVPYKEIGISENGLYEFTRVLSREYDIPYLSVPLLFEKRVFLSNRGALFFDAGLNARLTWGGSGSGINNIMEVTVSGNRLPIINFTAGAGYQLLSKKNNLLKVGGYINLSPTWLARGSFVLNTSSSYDSGEYIINGSSVGLSIHYYAPKPPKK
jgi:hypothetical protein